MSLYSMNAALGKGFGSGTPLDAAELAGVGKTNVMILNRSVVGRCGASPARLWLSVGSMGTLKRPMTGLKYSRATRFLCAVVVSGVLSASAQVREAWVQTLDRKSVV